MRNLSTEGDRAGQRQSQVSHKGGLTSKPVLLTLFQPHKPVPAQGLGMVSSYPCAAVGLGWDSNSPAGVVGLWFSRSVMSNSCDPMGSNPPGSSLHGISQARILE